jgi:hypothetical protein
MLAFHPAGFRAMARASAEDVRDVLPDITVPTLLVYGDGDVRAPLTVAEDLYAAISGSTLVVLPDTGHLCNIEALKTSTGRSGAFSATGAADHLVCAARGAEPSHRATGRPCERRLLVVTVVAVADSQPAAAPSLRSCNVGAQLVDEQADAAALSQHRPSCPRRQVGRGGLLVDEGDGASARESRSAKHRRDWETRRTSSPERGEKRPQTADLCATP